MNWVIQKFQQLSVREKSLLNGFVWILLLLWLILTLTWLGSLFKDWNTTSYLLRSQDLWLEKQEPIELNLQESLQRFNPEKTFNSSSLIGRVDALARETGVNHNISTPKSKSADRFDFHTMRVNVKKTKLDKILVFADKIRAESPYINLESVRLNADQRDPQQLDGQFIIKSFELKQ